MRELKELQDAVNEGLKIIEKQKDVKEAEVYASSNDLKTMRICYATNVPNNALEEPKSQENFGISVRVHFDSGHIGFGSVDSAVNKDAVLEAFKKTQHNRVQDSDFKSLPAPGEKPSLKDYCDKKIISLDDEIAIEYAYRALHGALDNLNGKKFEEHLNITGAVEFLSERMAVANSNGINEFDESTIAVATLTTIFELKKDVSGYWFDSATSLKELDSYNVGEISVDKAYALRKATHITSGKYDVVLGRQAFADLLYNRFSVSLSSVDVGASQYIGRLDEQLAPEFMNISDNGILEGAIGSKRVTDEGLATGKTEILKNGKLVNFISNDYYTKKYSSDKRFNAKNGFRFGGGGRNYGSEPGISATNLVVDSGKHSQEELFREIKNGLYIGRIWYSYPVNGYTSADFTSTIRGDTYVIKDGEIHSALVPNTLRINDNFDRCLKETVAIGNEAKATLAWGEENVVITPEIVVKGLRVNRIAKGLY